mmetsp:Transcript_9135/g.20920  ORF Transcript_9135/g.20920 Transcript_9135/m.20920 type:complete len:201 (-) Transcript_9135:106-708(-)
MAEEEQDTAMADAEPREDPLAEDDAGEDDAEDDAEDGDAGEDGGEDEEDDGDGEGEAEGSGRVKGVSKDKVTKGDHEKKQMAMQTRAGLQFPVYRFAKALRKGGYAKRLAPGGAIYLTAVIEYVTAEILELAGNAAKDQNKKRIIPRHIQLAIRNDEELNKYMSNVTISGGGVIPNIHSQLLPRKAGAGKDAAFPMSQEF